MLWRTRMGRLPGITGNGGTAQPWEESGSLPSGGSEHECWTGLFQRRACGKSPTQARQELSHLRHLKSPVWLEPSRAGGDRVQAQRPTGWVRGFWHSRQSNRKLLRLSWFGFWVFNKILQPLSNNITSLQRGYGENNSLPLPLPVPRPREDSF